MDAEAHNLARLLSGNAGRVTSIAADFGHRDCFFIAHGTRADDAVEQGHLLELRLALHVGLDLDGLFGRDTIRRETHLADHWRQGGAEGGVFLARAATGLRGF